MATIVVNEDAFHFADDRVYAHVRAALVHLVIVEQCSFLLEKPEHDESVAVLVTPSSRIKLLDDGADTDADNETWFAALVKNTKATHRLWVIPESESSAALDRLEQELAQHASG